MSPIQTDLREVVLALNPALMALQPPEEAGVRMVADLQTLSQRRVGHIYLYLEHMDLVVLLYPADQD